MPPPLPPGPPPVPGPPGPPHDPRARAPWLTPATAGVAVAAVVLGAAAVWFVMRDDEPVREAHGTMTPSATATATGPTSSRTPTKSASPSPSPSTSTSASAAAGHTTLTDPNGFRIAVPEGWNREENGTGVFYRSPDRTALIQVFRVVEPELSPLDAVQGASKDLRARTPNYSEVRVGEVPGGAGAAELVYEYDSAESNGRRRGVERVLFAEDGNKWAVLVAGPAAEWPRTQEHLAAALGAFRPGG
ncbi:hypothetical protein ACGFYU_36180 [Streptomyces sp. NPDC048337]|uniref:hypothetical protein n=1 Tax=Streptomyces sp. NPDC048337 TaxID=3365535 RepID=UPI00371823B7